ncbi:MAG: hypothetical protein HC906_07575 [Bacteroidales bacterium]|nr:hypothetical protein [Bacteroidales bacterium]
MNALNKLLSGFSLATCCFLSSFSQQGKNNPGPNIYVGFSGGINFTQPIVKKSFDIIQPLTIPEQPGKFKTYKPLFSNPGNQFHFQFWYPVKMQLHVGISPGMAAYTYKYNTETNWPMVLEQTQYNCSKTININCVILKFP